MEGHAVSHGDSQVHRGWLKRVEKLHRAWPKSRDYLPPPKVGTLADLDTAQIVKPPKGMEIGYVPIAIRQEMGPSR